MDLDLDFNALREESKKDDTRLVTDAIKRLMGRVDKIVTTGEDAEEIVDQLDNLASVAKTARLDLRDHRPVAALGSSAPAQPTASPQAYQPVADPIAQEVHNIAAAIGIESESLLSSLRNLMVPLHNNFPSQEKFAGAITVIERVASGRLPFTDANDGTLVAEMDLVARDQTIATLRQEKNDALAAKRTAEGNVTTANAAKDKAEKDLRDANAKLETANTNARINDRVSSEVSKAISLKTVSISDGKLLGRVTPTDMYVVDADQLSGGVKQALQAINPELKFEPASTMN